MKKTNIIFLFTFILLLGVVNAQNFNYTGDSFTFTNMSHGKTYTSFTNDGTNLYGHVSHNTWPLGSNGVYMYDNFSSNYDYCYIPSSLDTVHMVYNPDRNHLVIDNEQAQFLWFIETGASFCNGSYFGTNGGANAETVCGFESGGNIQDLQYNDGYIYVFGSGNTGYGELCILNANTYAYVSLHNISDDIESGLRFVDGTALTDDRLNILDTTNNIVYTYSITDEINENSLIDSFFPDDIVGGGNTYVNDTGLYTVASATVYEHEYDGVSNETNFPYYENNGIYYSTTQCFQQTGSGCLGDTSLYLCDNGGTIFNERSECLSTYGFTYGLETACDSTSNIEYCVSGCTTAQAYDGANDINYYYGTCNPQECTNECSVTGWSCVSGSARKYCDDGYDADACLEYSAIAYCDSGEFCSAGECVGFNFTRDDYEITLPEFEIKLYQEDSVVEDLSAGFDLGTSYSIDPFEPRILNVQTTNAKHVQQFGYELLADTTDYFYVGMDCDFTRSSLISEDFQTGDFNATGFTTIGDAQVVDRGVNDYWLLVKDGDDITGDFGVVRSNIYIDFDFHGKKTNDAEDFNFILRDDSLNVVGEIRVIENDDTGTSLSYYWVNATNETLLFNDVSTEAHVYTHLDFFVDQVHDVFTISAENFRATDYSIHYSAPLPLRDDINTGVQISVEINDGDVYFDNLEIVTIDDLPNFEEKRPNAYDNTCIYTNGCHVARMYLSIENEPIYHNYKEFTVCVELQNNLGSTGAIGELTKTEKLIFTIGILFIIIIFFTIVGFASQAITPSLFAGVLIGTGWLIVASVIGWIPSWIIIIMIILASAVIARSIARVGG